VSDLTIKSEDIIREISDGNPFYSIVVASEIAVRYSIRSPLRGATGPDKPVLAIQKLNTLIQDLENPASSEELTGLFDMFGRRILNEGHELVGDYDEGDEYRPEERIDSDQYDGRTVFSGEDDLDDDDYDDDADTDVPEDDDDLEDDDLDASEDEIDEIDNK
jgi:hypothetical protein